MCCSPWGCKESDTTERLNHSNKEILSWIVWVGPMKSHVLMSEGERDRQKKESQREGSGRQSGVGSD